MHRDRVPLPAVRSRGAAARVDLFTPRSPPYQGPLTHKNRKKRGSFNPPSRSKQI
jgi:hypothetical protein